MLFTLHIDGASRGNPGPAGAGFVIVEKEGTRISSGSRYLGIQTNNFAEYSALIDGLRKCLELGVDKLMIYSDSELLVRQVKGQYRVKSHNILPLYNKASRLLKKIDSVDIIHIRRELNSEADGMANRAIDENKKGG